MRGNRTIQFLAAAAVTGAALFATPLAGAAEKTLTVWSHFADHVAVRAMFLDIEKVLEEENPDIDLQMTFYEKNALFAAQMTALRAGEGPDIIYLEPDRVQFIESGFVRPIDDVVDLDRLHDFAKETWTVDGKVYALGMQAFTVELYYHKELMDKVLKAALGVDRFATVSVSSGEVGVAKPHPEVFRTALRKAGVEANEALHVGDGYESDVLGATHAGLHALFLLRDRGVRAPEGCATVRALTDVLGFVREGA